MKIDRASIATICFMSIAFLFVHTIISLITAGSIRSQELKIWKLKNKIFWTRTSPGPIGPIICDRTQPRYDICSINGPTLMDSKAYTFFSLGPTNSAQKPAQPVLVKTRPYPRKPDQLAMAKVKEMTLTSSPPNVPCAVTHSSPALVLSTSGYTTNFFHQFNEGIIPLFITVNELFNDPDFIIVISGLQEWWYRRYTGLLPHFSRHPIIDMDNQTGTHCFPSVIVGLISHGPMTINSTSLPNPNSLLTFHSFLEEVYGGDGGGRGQLLLRRNPIRRPKLVLVNRKGKVGRVIVNLREVKQAAEAAGFDVTVFEPTRNTSLLDSFELIHGSDVLMGVHGAALTNFLFLRRGAVFVQVVPINTEWLSETYFGKPARVLGMEYMEYRIGEEESSLVDKYGRDHTVVRDPKNFTQGNWSKMLVYLRIQNVKIDVKRFEKCLNNAYLKAKKFMEREN